jgi:hypothetical protein
MHIATWAARRVRVTCHVQWYWESFQVAAPPPIINIDYLSSSYYELQMHANRNTLLRDNARICIINNNILPSYSSLVEPSLRLAAGAVRSLPPGPVEC